ncbi:MAG: nucleoside-diphosphate sugar epimerase [Verrucomicrobia bacterium]|nr:nucleoside-diphosphate sugar epimerase [Verrucomicrobiota bacterium]
MNQEPSSIHIWRFIDGKPGHQNQSLGLIQALQKRVHCEVNEWEIPSTFFTRWSWRRKWRCEAEGLAVPDLILGAGHRTHSMVLRARQRFGGRSVVLMKPSFPIGWFDLCVVPEHDHVNPHSSIFQVKGVLNTMELSEQSDASKGLMLIGGPCRHVEWSDDDVIQQVASVVSASRKVRWELTTSRRTPDSFLVRLEAKCSSLNLTVTPVSQTQPGWVAEKLCISNQVWATSDSVSMLYESLTAGAATGVLDVPWTTTGKLREGLEHLVESKMVTPFSEWNPGDFLSSPPTPLAEADRVADWIMKHWFQRGSQ